MPLGREKVEALKLRVASTETVDEIAYRDGRWEIHASVGMVSDKCASCSGPLAHHAWSKGRFLDSPILGDPVRLHVTRPRYRCRICRKTFSPNVFGLVESHRVTDRLVRYIVDNVFSTSIRDLAVSVGTTAKTLSEILNAIAEQARQTVVTPVEIRIHELRLNEDRHLILLDLANDSVIDFFPSHPQQLDQVSGCLIRTNELLPTQVVSIPADRSILKLVASACPSARIDLPLPEIHSSLARFVATHGVSGSKKGKPGSISRNEGARLAFRRRGDLSREDTVRYSNGLCSKNEFWSIYDAKEQLLYGFEQSCCHDWVNLFRSWHSKLSLQSQLASQELKSFVGDAERLGVKLRVEPAKPFLIMHIDRIQNLLLKPGTSFSVEMISALVFSFRAFKEPKSVRFGPTTSGPLSLEEQRAIFWLY